MNLLSTYIATRCHALLQKLLSENMLRELTHVKDLEELSDTLMQTAYNTKMRDLKEITAPALNNVYKEKFLERITLLQKNADGGLRRFLIDYLTKFDIENLIQIMRKKETGRPIGEADLLKLPYSRLPYSELLQAKSLGEVFTLLKDTPHKVEEKWVSLHREYNSLLPVEGYLWRQFYKSAIKSVSNLPDSEKRIRELLRMEIDLRNCFTAVGPPLFGNAPELAESLFIRPTYRVSLSTLKKILHSENPQKLLEDLPYPTVMEALLKQKESKAEVEGAKQIKKWLMDRKLKNFVSSLYVILYLKLTEFEFKNLTKLTYGIKYNLPSEAIEENMILTSSLEES